VLSTPENSGPAPARNIGWRAKSAPVLAFIDDDCVPGPGWLEAGLAAFENPRLGVLQGQTRRPAGATIGNWTLWREITGPTAFFEGCNLFFRREAFEQTGGFHYPFYGEDTVAGWSVVDAGWERGYAGDAVVLHDVEERGVGWHVRAGLQEHHLVDIAVRHPGFRAEAFWRPWAFRRENAACTAALAGVVLARWWRPALLLAVPYLRWRFPRAHHPERARLALERLAVDAAQSASLAVGSVRHRTLVL
jgi:GT2 family glycosyltransferase